MSLTLPESNTVIRALIDHQDALVARNDVAGGHRLSLLDDMYVERGSKEDWMLLKELHYKGHALAAGSRFMGCVLDHDGRDETIGIMVFRTRPLDCDRMPVGVEAGDIEPNARIADASAWNGPLLYWAISLVAGRDLSHPLHQIWVGGS